MTDAADACLDLETTSHFLGFAPQHIFYLVEKADDLYTSIEVAKKSSGGGFRTLDIPFSDLKGVQREINRKILSAFDVSDSSHSYVPGRSVLTAAKALAGDKSVLKIDIQNFFPSITIQRVFGLLISLGFNGRAAFILSRLMTKSGHLSQGAPTSPALSNIIVRRMDERLDSLARSWELSYLRYSDDMFFSHIKNFNHPRFAVLAGEIVERSQFSLNLAKTRYYPRGKPRVTLGLLTHGSVPRIPGPQRRAHRSAFFKASRDPDWGYENRARLKGILEWHKNVNGRDETYFRYRAAYENIERVFLHKAYKSGVR